MHARVILTSKSFAETCAYLCQRQTHAQVIDWEGVRPYDHRQMAEDFERQHELMPTKLKPVFHAALTFPPGESVSDERLVELGQKYLQKIGMEHTQYALIKHTDKDHLHVHVLANRVNNDGDPIGKGLIIEQSIKVARELTEEYSLQQDEGKRLNLTHRNALHEPDLKRYQIYEAVQAILPNCTGMDELEKELLERGITMRYRIDESTGERQGISFRLDNRSFKGSQVDKEYSLRRLEEKLALRQKLTVELRPDEQLIERQWERQKEDLIDKLRRSLKPEMMEVDDWKIRLREQLAEREEREVLRRQIVKEKMEREELEAKERLTPEKDIPLKMDHEEEERKLKIQLEEERELRPRLRQRF